MVPHNMKGKDIIRAQDFNYLMVLGKGSFGKVSKTVDSRTMLLYASLHYLLGQHCCVTGDAGREERNWRALRNQDSEERHHHPRWWYWLHDDREASAGHGTQTAFPSPDSFLLPNYGTKYFLQKIKLSRPQCYLWACDRHSNLLFCTSQYPISNILFRDAVSL